MYRRAAENGGYRTMNHGGEVAVGGASSGFHGHTNAGTNETIHDIKHTLRPNLRSGAGFKP